MCGALSEKCVGGGVVDINVVVVRSNSELGSIWGVLHSFDPFLGVSVSESNLVEVAKSSHCQTSVIVTNGDVLIVGVECDSSGTHGVGEISQG